MLERNSMATYSAMSIFHSKSEEGDMDILDINRQHGS